MKTVAYMRELRVTHVINTASRSLIVLIVIIIIIIITLITIIDRHHKNDNEAAQGCLVANGEVVKHGGRADDLPSANIAPFFR